MKTSKYHRANYEGFNKTINGFKLKDDDYNKIEDIINSYIFTLLRILHPLHPKYIDKVCKVIREIK